MNIHELERTYFWLWTAFLIWRFVVPRSPYEIGRWRPPSAKKDGDTLNNELDDENDAEGAPGESWWLPKGTKDGTKHQPGRWMGHAFHNSWPWPWWKAFFFFTTCTGSFRLILRAQYISRRDGSVDWNSWGSIFSNCRGSLMGDVDVISQPSSAYKMGVYSSNVLREELNNYDLWFCWYLVRVCVNEPTSIN